MEKYFEKIDDKLILIFDEVEKDDAFVINKINKDGRNRGVNSTFYLMECDRFEFDEENPKYEDYIDKACFVIGIVEGDYYKLDREIFKIENDYFIDSSLRINKKYFYKYPNVSLIRTLSNYANSTIWIDSENKYNQTEDKKYHISKKYFDILLKKFPNATQMEYYKFSEIDKVLKDFFETNDYETRYKEYVEKHQKLIDSDFFDKQIENFSYAGIIDLEKNRMILNKLNKLLNMEVSENEWQEELLPYIRLLFPQYVYVIDEIGILDFDNKSRRIDYILIDYDGNVDIIELKLPQIPLLRKTQYRDNYIESTDLTGAIMQCDKYLVDLTSQRELHEKKIMKKLKEKVGMDYEVHINRPQALIIAGRSKDFSNEEKGDFQVIKRKYANIADIISYDDLVNRLVHMIESVGK